MGRHLWHPHWTAAVVGFNLDVECINAEKGILTNLRNPNVKDLKRNFGQLRRLRLCDEENSNEQLPVHVILGAADYQRIRSTRKPILGANPDQDPGAEYTMLGSPNGTATPKCWKTAQLTSLHLYINQQREGVKESEDPRNSMAQRGRYASSMLWAVSLPSHTPYETKDSGCHQRNIRRPGLCITYHDHWQNYFQLDLSAENWLGWTGPSWYTSTLGSLDQRT